MASSREDCRSGIGAALAASPASSLPGKRASVAIDSSVWDSFWKEAMTAPALKSFKSSMSGLKNTVSSIPGKMKALGSTSGKGQTAVLGRTSTSALAAPPPPRVT